MCQAGTEYFHVCPPLVWQSGHALPLLGPISHQTLNTRFIASSVLHLLPTLLLLHLPWFSAGTFPPQGLCRCFSGCRDCTSPRYYLQDTICLVAQMTKCLPAMRVDLGSIPGSGRSPGEGNGNPLQYSCLENPMDGGAWWATVHGVTKSRRTRLSNSTFFQDTASLVPHLH